MMTAGLRKLPGWVYTDGGYSRQLPPFGSPAAAEFWIRKHLGALGAAKLHSLVQIQNSRLVRHAYVADCRVTRADWYRESDLTRRHVNHSDMIGRSRVTSISIMRERCESEIQRDLYAGRGPREIRRGRDRTLGARARARVASRRVAEEFGPLNSLVRAHGLCNPGEVPRSAQCHGCVRNCVSPVFTRSRRRSREGGRGGDRHHRRAEM